MQRIQNIRIYEYQNKGGNFPFSISYSLRKYYIFNISIVDSGVLNINNNDVDNRIFKTFSFKLKTLKTRFKSCHATRRLYRDRPNDINVQTRKIEFLTLNPIE